MYHEIGGFNVPPFAMTWFADLSPYTYLSTDPQVLNVGWLDGSRGFSTGDVPREFVEELQVLARRPQKRCRGMHFCDLCTPPEDCYLDPRDRESTLRFFEWAKDRQGNGELRVRGCDGKVYAAPVMIVHYVEAHRYLPPSEFIEAVLNARASQKNLYLAVDGLGGGVWVMVAADSPEEIERRHPDWKVVRERPPWMDEAEFQRIGHAQFDLDDEELEMIIELLTEANES
jgi:hypothetical protein